MNPPPTNAYGLDKERTPSKLSKSTGQRDRAAGHRWWIIYLIYSYPQGGIVCPGASSFPARSSSSPVQSIINPDEEAVVVVVVFGATVQATILSCPVEMSSPRS
jgi:hypothetical protein